MPLGANWLKQGWPRNLLRGLGRASHTAFPAGRVVIVALWLWLPQAAPASEYSQTNSAPPYPPNVQQVLTTYCYDCHGDGMEKGKVALDQFSSHAEMLARKDVFFAAL